MRYGTFKHGSGVLYGSSGNTNHLWGLEVDWNGDGRFDGSNEARYMVDLWLERGRNNLIREDGIGFQQMEAGFFTAVLENVDGRYDPYNSSSPLYPYVLPGRKTRLRMKNGSSGAWQAVMAGKVADIQPVSGREQVYLTVVDDTIKLQKEKITLAIQQNQQVDDLMHLVLTEVGWPLNERAIDSVTDTIPYWWADRVSAWEALNELAEGVLGTFFIGADGKATFISRNHSTTAAVTLNQAELSDEVNLSRPWKTVRNDIKVIARPRVAVAATELWRLPEVMSLAAGETKDIWATYTYDGEEVPAAVVSQLAATTDYTMNTAANGSGSDLTSSMNVILTKFGRSVKLRITNWSVSTGYITLLKLMGTALSAPNKVEIKRQNSVSQKRYEKLYFELSSDWLQDSNLATSFADNLISKLPLVRAFPEVQLERQADLQFALDLGTRVALNVPAKGLTNVFAVGRLSHRWVLATNGQAVQTTARFEPLDPASVQWEFPVKMGEESYFAF
jgi:hypothetical protein